MVEIRDMLTETRFPPGFQFALMILYFPIGVFLIVCRVLIALHTYMIVCLMPRASARRQFVRGMLGVLGVHIWVDDDTGEACPQSRILVSNYTSVMDHIVIDVVISHIVPYSGNVPKVFQWVLGYKDLGSEKGKEQFQTNIKQFIQEHDLPVLVHPEGIPTNNTVGLLKFDPFAFELELPVQPVSVTMSRLSFPCALTTVDSPRWTDVLWCFFTPVTVFKVKTHPVITRGEEESSVEFAERARGVMGDFLNLKKTDITCTDVKDYIKKLKTPPPVPVRVKPVSVGSSAAINSGAGTGNNSNSGGSCLESVDAELRKMIQQVKDVLPQVPVYAVQQDLEQTKDVDATISNILEGRVVYSQPEETTSKSAPKIQPAIDKDSTLFKASTFPKSATDRHLSLEERKNLMLETARLRYKQKHGML